VFGWLWVVWGGWLVCFRSWLLVGGGLSLFLGGCFGVVGGWGGGGTVWVVWVFLCVVGGGVWGGCGALWVWLLLWGGWGGCEGGGVFFLVVGGQVWGLGEGVVFVWFCVCGGLVVLGCGCLG